MGDVLQFPDIKTPRFDPRGLEVLKGLEAAHREQFTYLGECDLSEGEIKELTRVLYEHRDLRAIRVIGDKGQDLMIFRGQLPSFNYVF